MTLSSGGCQACTLASGDHHCAPCRLSWDRDEKCPATCRARRLIRQDEVPAVVPWVSGLALTVRV